MYNDWRSSGSSHTTIHTVLLPQHGTRTALQTHCWRSLTLPKNAFQRVDIVSDKGLNKHICRYSSPKQRNNDNMKKKNEHLCLDWLDLHNHISRTGRVVLVAQSPFYSVPEMKHAADARPGRTSGQSRLLGSHTVH